MKNEVIHELLFDMNREIGEIKTSVDHIQKRLEDGRDKKKFLAAWIVSVIALLSSLVNHAKLFLAGVCLLVLTTGCVQLGQTRAGKTTVVGLSIRAFDPVSQSPRLDLGYISHESTLVDKAHKVTIKKEYKDVDLFESKGSVKTLIDVSKR